MKRRVMTLLLAVLLIIAWFPVSADAASEESEIKKEIVSVYRRILYRNGLSSTNGWCGLQTSWQMYLLGINKSLISQDGRDQYDTYRNMAVTTGGYRVKAYSGEEYSLEEALNAITRNGTRDAYNILVGFQWTNTAGGRKYGHAVFIHAVLDGKVYFTEGFAVAMGNRYNAPGSAMIGTIAEFCESYGSWTRYEGSIHFMGGDYQDDCDAYPTNLYVQVTEQTQLLSDPGTIGEKTPDVCREVAAGERLHATGLYQNRNGGCYYEITEDDGLGYINAEKAEMLFTDDSDLTISGVSAPAVHTKGTSFALKAQLTTVNNSIDSVLIQVLRDGEPVLESETQVDSRSFQINRQEIRDVLKFNKLEAGEYSLRITANILYHYIADGKLETRWQSADIWNSEFVVMAKNEPMPTVTYDAQGGSAGLNQQVARELTQLPQATREGCEFAGWFTEPEGGTKVTAGTRLTEDTTLYAHWKQVPSQEDGWIWQDGWYYFENGQPKTGWLTEEGLRYYIQEDGAAATGWRIVEGALRCFGDNGVMRSGWIDSLSGPRYMLSDGAAAEGWTRLEGQIRYFDIGGILHTGWLQTGNTHYYLDENGVPSTGYQQYPGMDCYFDSTGILTAAVCSTDGAGICYLRTDGREDAFSPETFVEKTRENSKTAGEFVPAMAF